MNLAVTIPSAVVWVFVIAGAWWAAAYWGFSRILNWHLHRYLRRHKTGTVPNRYMNMGYVIAGPVGWVAWAFDAAASSWKRSQR